MIGMIGVAMSWECGCSSDAPAASPWFLNTRTYSKRGSFLRSSSRSRKASSTSATSSIEQVASDAVVVGRLDDDLVGAHAVHPVEEPLARRLEVALDAQRRELVRHHAVRPARLVRRGRRAARPARISGGVLLLVARAEDAERRPRRARAPAAKSEGRRARSVEMITQRPTTGSLRSSGMRSGGPRASRPAPSSAASASARRLALEEHGAHLLADRQRSRRAGAASASAERTVRDALGDHARARARTCAERAALREGHAERAVAREAPGARQHEVARARRARPASPAGRRARRARRVISASPRVTSAARAFSPRPRPSASPVAMAMTFFSAPPDLHADHVAVGVEPELARARARRCSRRPARRRARRPRRRVGRPERDLAREGRARRARPRAPPGIARR